MNAKLRIPSLLVASFAAWACLPGPASVSTDPAVAGEKTDVGARDEIDDHAEAMLEEGRETFRYDTFGSEEFWTQTRLHEAILGEKQGGVGPGLKAIDALEVGLKVDILKLPQILLRCAFCHSTVDDSFAKGIGRRLDGWPNRDLDVGAIVAMSPNLKPFQDLLGVDEATVRKVLLAWGPGRYDAELDQDGKGFRPDGKTAATLLPAAFGLAGVNLHTYTGWGSVPYWNAYVATTQMHGKGTFFDPRIQKNPKQYPVGAKAGLGNVRSVPDLVTPKLAALHFYQLAIPAPKPRKDSYDAAAAERGRLVFEGSGRCASCHVPPLFTEPGWSMHTGEEIGIDNFQASRSPDKRFYRTTPLAGLFVRAKGGFYHDGRFADYLAVVDHYDRHFDLRLAEHEKGDLVEYLKSL